MNEHEILARVRAVGDAARRDDPTPPIGDIEALAGQALVDLHRIADALEKIAGREF